ncbi:MAG TPA: hypothetical protein VH143_32135 [Kofleriaceae bacterium]|jgi:hypothetical protein|nr:hypothetical protein [Kofleriaceae bacterium]
MRALVQDELSKVSGGVAMASVTSTTGTKTFHCNDTSHQLVGAFTANPMCTGAGFAYPARVTHE